MKSNVTNSLQQIDNLLSSSIDKWPRILWILGDCQELQFCYAKLLHDYWNNTAETTIVDSQGLSTEQLTSQIQQTDLFSSKKLIKILQCEKNKLLAEGLLKLNQIPESISLLIEYKGKLEKAYKSKCHPLIILESNELDSKSLTIFVQWYSNKIGIHLDKDLLSQISTGFEGNLSDVLQQLQLLSLVFAKDQSQNISLKQAWPYLQTLSKEQSFLITQTILDDKWEKATYLIDKLIQQGESQIALSGLIAYFIRQVITVHHKSLNPNKNLVAKVPPFLLTRYQQFSKKYGANAVDALHMCQKLDVDFKTSSSDATSQIGEILLTLRKGNLKYV